MPARSRPGAQIARVAVRFQHPWPLTLVSLLRPVPRKARGVSAGPGPGLAQGLYKLTPFLEYTIYPVIDATEALPLLTEAVEFRNSVK